jgi:hypothetical protein
MLRLLCRIFATRLPIAPGLALLAAISLTAAAETAAAEELTEKPRPKSGRDHSIPYYLQKRPVFALQLSGVAHESETLGNAGELALEVQPPWTQVIGVISVGGHLRYHLADAGSRLIGYGVRAAYQAKWFARQWLVPVVGYSYDRTQYSLSGGASGTLASPAVFYGVRFFLSEADPAAAAELYNGLGVSRAYLSFETSEKTAANADLSLAGRATTVGLRFEL